MGHSGRDYYCISGGYLHHGSLFTPKLHTGRSGVDSQYLMGRAVEMVERIDTVSPASLPPMLLKCGLYESG